MPERRILMGVIGRPHGVRGLLHVRSYTANPTDLPRYAPLTDERGRTFALRWQADGIAAVTEIVAGKRVLVAGRTEAERLVNLRLYAARSQLPAPDEDEFYLADLIGLEAFRPDGVTLGRIDAVHDYGAGASVEIGSLLVPFTRACVPVVNLAEGRVTIELPVESSPPPLEAALAPLLPAPSLKGRRSSDIDAADDHDAGASLGMTRQTPPPLEGGGRGEGSAPPAPASKNGLVAHAKAMRREPTPAERKLWTALRNEQLSGLRFRRQQPIGPFIADFYCPSAHLVVEIDGETHVDSSDDAKRDAWMRHRGLRVLRFWNNEVAGNLSGVLARIDEAALAPLPPAPSFKARGSVCTSDDAPEAQNP